MNYKTISELIERTPNSSMYLAVEDSNSTSKATIADVVEAASPVMRVNIEYDESAGGDVMDKTWQEIADAFIAGKLVYYIYANDESETYELWLVVGAALAYSGYEVYMRNTLPASTYVNTYSASTPTGYPVYVHGDET